MLVNFLLIVWLFLFTIFSYRQPKRGFYLLLFLLPFYLVRTEIWFIPTTLLELSIYLLFIIWLLKSKNWSLGISRWLVNLRIFLKKNSKSPLFWSISLLILACLISTIISPDKRISLGVLKGWFFDPLLLFFLVLKLVKTKKEIFFSVISLSLSCLILSLYGLWEYFFLPQSLVFEQSPGRLNSVFSSPNYHSLLTGPIIILFIGTGLILRDFFKKREWTVCFFFFSFVSLAAFYLTKSYGGYLGFFAGLFFLLFFLKKRWIYFSILFLLISAILFFQIPSEKFQAAFNLTNYTSSHARLQIWQASLLMIKEHPILGIGLGTFKLSYPEYLSQAASSPLEWSVILPHNLYLAFWTQTGLLGLLAFLSIIVLFFREGFKKPYFFAPVLMASMVSILVHGLVDTFYWKNDLSCLFWLLIGLMQINSKLSILPSPSR